jgi:hypothetical protein
LLDKVTLHLDPKFAKGREFTVIAKNNSPQNVYIQSATLNGQPFNTFVLSHDAIAHGGTLVLNMGPAPSNWGGGGPVPTPTMTSVPVTGARIDTIGVFRAGTFYLRLHNSTGIADLMVSYSPAASPVPVAGDWTGSGYDTVGVFDRSNGLFSLCTANSTASCASSANTIRFVLGNANDIPMAGRWQAGSTAFGAGVFRPSNDLIYVKNNLTTGFADNTMVLGIPGDVGLTGDWTGKGYDSPGVYRPSISTFYLSNKLCNCATFADIQVLYGIVGDAPVIGDWIGQGHDGIGLFRQNNGFTYLKNQDTTGFGDITFVYGVAGDVPVAGHWELNYPPAPSPIGGTGQFTPAPTFVPISGQAGANDTGS